MTAQTAAETTLGKTIHHISSDDPHEALAILTRAIAEDITDLLFSTGIIDEPWIGLFLTENRGKVKVTLHPKTEQLHRLKLNLDYEILVDQAAMDKALEQYRDG